MMMHIMAWEELGDAVRRRRRELGYTQPDVAARGGPSVATQRAIENNRAGRLTPAMRRAFEQALQWGPGSVDAILAGDAATSAGSTADGAPADHNERLSLAKQVVALKTTFAKHADAMGIAAREALLGDINRSAHEAEDALIKLMPWLDDAERGEAIELLVQLRAEV